MSLNPGWVMDDLLLDVRLFCEFTKYMCNFKPFVTQFQSTFQEKRIIIFDYKMDDKFRVGSFMVKLLSREYFLYRVGQINRSIKSIIVYATCG